MASFESIRARMSIKYILNPIPPQEPDYSAFPGHPRFSNGSMPMTLLVAPAYPAIANALADVWTWEWEREQESDFSTLSSLDSTPSTLLPMEASPVGASPVGELPVGELPVGTSLVGAPTRTSSPLTAQFSWNRGLSYSPDGPSLYAGPLCPPLSLPPFQFAPRPILTSPSWPHEVLPTSMETNLNMARYEDGEVLRYGAGESYRPFNNNGSSNNSNRERSPRRARSPLRDRERDPRPRTPPVTSDSYVPGRSPRRRSRSADRYRGPDRPRDNVGESWRRRDNSRGRVRSPIRRPSPPARRSPRRSPPRFSPAPRRDDRFDRARSPRRDFDNRDIRRRSRSPFDRDRRERPRSPFRRSPPIGPRGDRSYRPRSRSPDRPDRRDDRYAPATGYRQRSPVREREVVIPSTITSRSNSGISSPRPGSRGRDNRSRQHSPVARSPAGLSGANAIPVPLRTSTPRITSEPIQVPTKSPPRVRSPPRARSPPRVRSPPRARSPPRGPAALRAPPTGPSATRNFPTSNATQATPRVNPGSSYSRAETVSPTVPPSGPRGYANPRGGGYNMRGRGGWGAPPPRSHFAPAPASVPATPPTGPSVVPTGPRASISSAPSPSIASKPFNPPTGPAAQGGQRMTLAQNLINSMPPIIPGGKIDPASTPLSTGVTRDLEAHHRRLKEEEERIREELRAKDEKLRRSLRMWERLERESKGFELKSDLSERSLKTIAGEGLGGSAF